MDWITGYKIPFTRTPIQKAPPKKLCHSVHDKETLNSIQLMLKQGAISKCSPVKNQFISRFFLTAKKNGNKRFILNLKSLNQFMTLPHFKMEDIKTVKSLMFQNCYMTTIDLKDAYFLIPIHATHKKYLRFKFGQDLYQFNCLPFGLASAPYLFTKIVKPIVSSLRRKNISCVAYLDDFLVIGNSYIRCLQQTQEVLTVLQNLGFYINKDKSSLLPVQRCRYLGFILDSIHHTIEITPKKKKKILVHLRNLKNKNSHKILGIARLIGLLVSTAPAVKYGWAHIKSLEREKCRALFDSKQNYLVRMQIRSTTAQSDLKWWETNIHHVFNKIRKDTYDLEVETDASRTGWGACCHHQKVHGWWTTQDSQQHINALELKAALYGIKIFTKDKTSCNILLRLDNTTAIATINRMGSTKYETLDGIARILWSWCEERDLWVTATYICSKDNVQADQESRALPADTEWELAAGAYEMIVQRLDIPEIDLFASISNHKCQKYVSWKKDPDSIADDAFTIPWGNIFFYAFHPFNLVGRVLNKIVNEKAIGIVIIPHWPSQPWYPLFIKLLKQKPIFLGPQSKLLCSPFRQLHPLAETLTLVAGRLSGTLSA
jgi:hypothetical protein